VKLSLITLSLQVAAVVVVEHYTLMVLAEAVQVAIVLPTLVKHLVVEAQVKQD
jgi:hypothetical protein